MAKFNLAQIRNPSTVHKTTPCAKSRANPSIGGFLANGWNVTKIFLVYIYLFCWPTYRSDHPADFHTRWLGQHGLTQGSNLFGNWNSRLISNPRKILLKLKIGPKNGFTSNCLHGVVKVDIICRESHWCAVCMQLLRSTLDAEGHTDVLIVVPDAQSWQILRTFTNDSQFLDSVDIIG